MDLVLKLNDQLKEIEKDLDALVQLKKSDMVTTPKEVIPTVSKTVPSTLVTSLAPNAPPATTLPVTVESTTIIGVEGEKAVELVKDMEQMSIQVM